MLVIISPAKKLDFENMAPSSEFTLPTYLNFSKKLITEIKNYNLLEIKNLMKLSDSLAKLNIDRYQNFKTPFSLKNAKQAIYAFQGDTYKGFDVGTIKKDSLKYAQKHIKILSGLYGLISPLDLIQPYRLEMGTRLPCGESKNLYQFWGKVLTSEINQVLEKEKILINCASKEYFSVLDLNSIQGRVITPEFKEKKGDNYKVIGLFAKRARGMMARYIVDHKIVEAEDLLFFNEDSYRYNPSLSKKNTPVFTRG